MYWLSQRLRIGPWSTSSAAARVRRTPQPFLDESPRMICRLTGRLIYVVARPASTRARSMRSRGRTTSTRVSLENLVCLSNFRTQYII